MTMDLEHSMGKDQLVDPCVEVSSTPEQFGGGGPFKPV